MKPLNLISLFFFLLAVLGYLQPIHGLIQRRTFKEHYHKFQHTAAARRMNNRELDRVFYPVSYGADPSGVEDSSNAILRAVEDAFRVQKGLELVHGVNDLGGVIIDLQGGNYNISKPIRFPSCGGGNVVVQGGSLRASESFPANSYLIELYSPSSHRKLTKKRSTSNTNPNPNPVYYEDVTFRDVLFDSRFRGGGLLLVDSARTRVTNCFFLHFSTAGLRVDGGHETFVSDTFLGQVPTVGAGGPPQRNFSGVAIDLAGNDNAVTDVAIFSAAIGVVLGGQANILTGVHCYNKATSAGGVGILVKLAGEVAQTRIDNCYMDYTGIVLEDPVQVHVTNAFFLGGANVVLRSVNGRISGLTIVDNMFAGEGWRTPIVALDESKGPPFEKVEQVVVEKNNVIEMKVKSTVAEMTVEGWGKRWEVDFKGVLLFPDRISHVQYALYERRWSWRPSLAAHALTGVGKNRVVVETDRAVDAVVSVAVDQYLRPGETNHFM